MKSAIAVIAFICAIFSAHAADEKAAAEEYLSAYNSAMQRRFKETKFVQPKTLSDWILNFLNEWNATPDGAEVKAKFAAIKKDAPKFPPMDAVAKAKCADISKDLGPGSWHIIRYKKGDKIENSIYYLDYKKLDDDGATKLCHWMFGIQAHPGDIIRINIDESYDHRAFTQRLSECKQSSTFVDIVELKE